MQIREYSLPQGWYPRDPKEVKSEISRYLAGFEGEFDGESSGCTACIAPHAGWYYSGRFAALAVNSLDKDADTIAVIGGHLPENYPALFAMEDAVKTPFGAFPIDKDIRHQFMKEMDSVPCGCAEDKYRDNTVEVLLPFVRFFFPEAELLWLRLPASMDAYNAGKLLYKTGKKMGKKIAVAGSTDLTHYGHNYGFSPKGTGDAALRWVREVNDAAFIKAIESGDAEEVLMRAQQDFSSCSAGAVLGAMGFAGKPGHLLAYGTSADMDKGTVPDSFVGYAAMKL